MNLFHPISTIMTRHPITLESFDTIADAAKIFKQHNVHHIPIVENNKLVGIVSRSDYLLYRRGFLEDSKDEAVEENRLKNHEVNEIMTTGLAKMEPDDRINVALEIFKKNIFHAILIVKAERLVGIVTTFDIIHHLAADNEAHSNYSNS